MNYYMYCVIMMTNNYERLCINMAKLYFKYGTMNSSKTANALMTRFNYVEKNRDVLMLKPGTDTRSGSFIETRAGIEKVACILFNSSESLLEVFHRENEKLIELKGKKYDIIIIDECQFMTKSQVENLKDIVDIYNVSVFCFGLKTNYVTELFEGSKRLLELADSIAEIKSICKCGNKATINARIINGKVVKHLLGESDVDIGGENKYESICYRCYVNAEEYVEE